MEAGLYIVGTPIGNLGDATYRSIEVLGEVDLILAEDTRISRRLLGRYELKTHMESCHKFNEASRIKQVTDRIAHGASVALITDSGMPVVSDPGSRIVAACREAGIMVTAIPGPSAVTTAIALSGFGGDRFFFEGYIRPKSAARRRRLEELDEMTCAVVLFESPHRFVKLLTEMDELLGNRPLFVGRELTKKFEECLVGTAASILAAFSDRSIKGELVLVLGPKDVPTRKKDLK